MEGQYVLAIEHDWRIRKLIRANLEAVGLAVREAVSVQHGLALLRQDRPALILLNLDIPGLDALHLLAGLDAQLPRRRVPVILMSAEPPERALLEHHLAASHLLQPFSVSALLQQVRGALGDVAVGRPSP
jgi:DNA-binding response OmpR family regulator